MEFLMQSIQLFSYKTENIIFEFASDLDLQGQNTL